MSAAAPSRFLAALVVFAVIAAVALPAGLPRQGGERERSLRTSLEEAEKTLESSTFFHTDGEPPAFTATASFCGECHSLPPHPGPGAAPAFYNHHGTIFDCLVCHWSTLSGSQPDLAWDRSPGEGQEGRLVLRVADPLEGGSRDLASLRAGVVKKQTCFDRGLACRECHRC